MKKDGGDSTTTKAKLIYTRTRKIKNNTVWYRSISNNIEQRTSISHVNMPTATFLFVFLPLYSRTVAVVTQHHPHRAVIFS